MLQETTNAFVLHSRPFKETSLILHCFTQRFGSISVIAKGIKRKNAQSKRAILQPFNLLKISFTGKSDLKILCDSELLIFKPQPKANSLACCYYLNELILRALKEWQEYPELFSVYQKTIENICSTDGEELAKLLRSFEIALITFLGLSPDWHCDVDDQKIDASSAYEFVSESGFRKISNMRKEQSQHILSGKTINGIAIQDYSSIDLKEAQRITQKLIRPLIGNKPLESRKMWLQ